MFDVGSVFRQKIDDIQSRIPVKLPVKDAPPSGDGSNSARDFSAILQQQTNALNINSGVADVLTDNSSVSPDRSYIESVIDEICLKYNVDPNLIRSVIKAESNFDPRAVSSAGAMGLMQLMPSAAAGMGVTNPYDIVQNIDAGVRIIKGNLDSYNGNLALALAAYNAGAGAVQKYGGVPPYTETQNYIAKINNYLSAYNSVV